MIRIYFILRLLWMNNDELDQWEDLELLYILIHDLISFLLGSDSSSSSHTSSRSP